MEKIIILAGPNYGKKGREESQLLKLLYCIVLYCIVLYCIVLYCIVLYCIVWYVCMHVCMHVCVQAFRSSIFHNHFCTIHTYFC